MPKKKFKFHGWSAAHDRWLDNTGICHAQVIDEGSNQCRNACGSKAQTFGCTYQLPGETQSHPCDRCLRIVMRTDKSQTAVEVPYKIPLKHIEEYLSRTDRDLRIYFQFDIPNRCRGTAHIHHYGQDKFVLEQTTPMYQEIYRKDLKGLLKLLKDGGWYESLFYAEVCEPQPNDRDKVLYVYQQPTPISVLRLGEACN